MVNIHSITRRHATQAGLNFGLLKGGYSRGMYPHVRQAAMFDAYEAGYSQVRIGKYFGRDRSSVSQAIKRQEDVEGRPAKPWSIVMALPFKSSRGMQA